MFESALVILAITVIVSLVGRMCQLCIPRQFPLFSSAHLAYFNLRFCQIFYWQFLFKPTNWFSTRGSKQIDLPECAIFHSCFSDFILFSGKTNFYNTKIHKNNCKHHEFSKKVSRLRQTSHYTHWFPLLAVSINSIFL